MKAQIALIMVILLVVAGCNLNPSVTPEAPDVTITVTSEISNTSMTTYVDTRSGVAFDYPMGWTISPPPPEDALIYSYSIASYDLNNPPITPRKVRKGCRRD